MYHSNSIMVNKRWLWSIGRISLKWQIIDSNGTVDGFTVPPSATVPSYPGTLSNIPAGGALGPDA